jgi:hypothetical protein
MDYDIENAFSYENAFYLTANPSRIAKFANHLEFYRRAIQVPGAVVECGVFKGASLSRLVKFRVVFESPSARSIIAFDTFGPFPEAGLPEEQVKRDEFVEEAGSHSISREALSEIFQSLQLFENIELVEGDIVETAPAYVAAHDKLEIALLNIDVDLYAPTQAALKALYPLVVPGGIIILDDYGVFPGATRAIDEYFAEASGAKTQIERLSCRDAIPFIKKP